MKILLLGKFPPCQGGIAAKTYWLYRALHENEGWTFKVVTVSADPYSVPKSITSKVDGIDVHILENQSPPWVIPPTGLYTEQLLNLALAITEKEIPDSSAFLDDRRT